MNVTSNQPSSNESLSLNLAFESSSETSIAKQSVTKIKNLSLPSQLLLQSRIIMHNPAAGLNPIVDAAASLFSMIGKFKQIKLFRHLKKLKTELIEEVNTFQDMIKGLGYNSEYTIVCRYILCATLDEMISETAWGCDGQWDKYSLLGAFNQDTHHQDKFFTILERALKEPALYIELMEFMYLCLSLGYKGQYRTKEHHPFQLEQITNSLYKHIRAYRGHFSKHLSPLSFKSRKKSTKVVAPRKLPLGFICLATTCIIMAIFVGLGYLMDVISNEAYTHIATLENTVSKSATKP